MSTAQHRIGETQTCQVLHPFHPLRGQSLQVVELLHNWSEDRVICRVADGGLASVPLQWTSLCAPDPAISLTGGRSPFRLADLLELRRLLDLLLEEGGEDG